MAAMKSVEIADFRIGAGEPLCIIAGPCVVETRQTCSLIAKEMRDVCMQLGFNYIFKASYDKANRTSLASQRGPGLKAGLVVLLDIKERLGIPVVTDVHEAWQAKEAAAVADVLQVPAFLCRQTDLLLACGETGRAVNIKKGQFMAPGDMRFSVEKVRSTGNSSILLTERGATFGYNNLVVDFRSLPILREIGCPVVFDATHSLQLPSSQAGVSGGQREFAPHLARAAVAVGIDALFMEVHPHPEEAWSDKATTLPLEEIPAFLGVVADLRRIIG